MAVSGRYFLLPLPTRRLAETRSPPRKTTKTQGQSHVWHQEKDPQSVEELHQRFYLIPSFVCVCVRSSIETVVPVLLFHPPPKRPSSIHFRVAVSNERIHAPVAASDNLDRCG